MAKLANRAKMTISSTGTGNITLASAVAGYQSFLDAGVSDGDQIRYIVEDNSGADWEIGTAAVSNNSTVLVRTVEESSAANNAALNLTSSAKVFIGVTANDLDNAAPIFTTTPPLELDLAKDGSTAVTLNAKAYDESGIPVQYSWDAWVTGGTTVYDASSLPPQLASAPSINQSTGVYSLVGSSNTSNSGTMNFRVKASDGVKVATHVTDLTLEFTTEIVVSTTASSSIGTIASNSSTGYMDTSWTGSASSSGAVYAPLTAIKTGKRYIEVKNVHTENRGWVGIGDLTNLAAGTHGYTDTGKGFSVYFYNGRIYPSALDGGTPLSTFYQNDILMIAYDTIAGKIWFGKNGTWATDAEGGGDPTSGGSGLDISGINFTAGAAFMIASLIGRSFKCQFMSGSSNGYSYTSQIPTGFTAY